MALFKFTRQILNDQPILIYNQGQMSRDFSYIDDIVHATLTLFDTPPTADSNWDSNHPHPASSNVPYRVYNLGNNQPVALMDYVRALEQALGKTATLEMQALPSSDVQHTYADTDLLAQRIGFKPYTEIQTGINQFVNWYRSYYGSKHPA